MKRIEGLLQQAMGLDASTLGRKALVWLSLRTRQILASADPNAYAAFWNEGTAYGVFVAELNGNYYSCTSTSPAEPWFPLSAAPPTTSFTISWTSAGTCSVLWMEAGSQFK